jgi:hypothetical protein
LIVSFCFGTSDQSQGFRPEPILTHLELGDFQPDEARNTFSQARDPVGLLQEIVWYFQCTHEENLQQ